MTINGSGTGKMLENFSQSFMQARGQTAQINNMNEQSQRQQEQLDMLQAKNQDVVQRQFIADFNEAVFEADHYGNAKSVEKFMKTHKEDFGGQYLSGMTQSDIFEGGETLSPALRQRYKDETGFALPTPGLPGFIDWVDRHGNYYEAGTTVTDVST